MTIRPMYLLEFKIQIHADSHAVASQAITRRLLLNVKTMDGIVIFIFFSVMSILNEISLRKILEFIACFPFPRPISQIVRFHATSMNNFCIYFFASM